MNPNHMARATDPETSRAAAAEHLASGANAAQRAAVLAAIQAKSAFGIESL